MQYLVIFSPKQKFQTDGMPSDFMEMELKEQAQVRVLQQIAAKCSTLKLVHQRLT